MLFLNLFKVMEVVRAFRINALVNNKVFAVFLVNKRMRAMGASQDDFVGEWCYVKITDTLNLCF